MICAPPPACPWPCFRALLRAFIYRSRTTAHCFFFSSRRRHTRCLSDWSSDVCSSDLRAVQLTMFRGLPKVEEKPCEAGCKACVDACPANAIALDPVRIDLGKCTFCAECT